MNDRTAAPLEPGPPLFHPLAPIKEQHMPDNPQPDPFAAGFEAVRRAMAAVAADRPTPEQTAEWNTTDREMAQRIRAALPGVPLHHAYAVLQALRVTQRLDAAAAAPDVVPSAPADRAALLREAANIAESLRQFEPATGARKSAQVSENVGILRVADELRRMADEAQQQCPGFETQPNRCSCDCEGCPHNCAAHQPAAVSQPGKEA